MTISGKKYLECTILGSGNGGGGAEAEDSSYDSDYEADESQAESQVSASKHSDVSRTTSDTLAAEFAEYVTVHPSLPHSHTPGYTARVEFALKLGYTEQLVQAALAKLGPEPQQNELLAELIRLGASSAGPSGPRLADTADELEAQLPADCSEQQQQQHQPQQQQVGGESEPAQLRPVVIDGSNVAMSHGNKLAFSCRGIKIAVDWFRARGHAEITVFVPKWRKEAARPDNPVVDQEILGELERDRLLVFTPSRLVGGKRMVCYDDRYILRLAAELDGIVVSNDNYRDLAQENPEFRKVVEERVLMYSFVNDRFMPPDDPLGRSGPTLDNFLRLGPRRAEPAPPCPYAKKCTYGNKCKFRHPERGAHPHKSVTERLLEHAQRQLQARSSQQQQQQQHTSVGKTNSWAAQPSSSHSSTACSSVLKSRSVENVAAAEHHSQASYSPAAGAAAATAGGSAYPSAVGWVAPRVANPEPEPANMHRKLQRQLSLNPSCDPRISQMRSYHQQAQQFIASHHHHIHHHHQHQQQQQQQLKPHRPLVPQQQLVHGRQLTGHASNDTSYSASISWEQRQQQQQQQQQHQIQRRQQQHHQLVTRIASAPDSYRDWRVSNRAGSSSPRLGCNSEPQLNTLAAQQQQDARRHLHYHLANIFPEEQVHAAMAIHPHETDPQQICAAILSMFPKL